MTLSPAIGIHRTLIRHQRSPASLVTAESAWCNPDPVSLWFHVETHAFARPVRTRCLPWAVGVLSAGHPYRWLCTCTNETLRTNAFARNVHRDIWCFRVVFLNVIEWAVAFERRVHECSALLYEELWSFSSHPLSFWSSFFRSCISQPCKMVLHFPVLYFSVFKIGPPFSTCTFSPFVLFGPPSSGPAFSIDPPYYV